PHTPTLSLHDALPISIDGTGSRRLPSCTTGLSSGSASAAGAGSSRRATTSPPGERHTCFAPGAVAFAELSFNTGPRYSTSLYTEDRKSTRLNSSHDQI